MKLVKIISAILIFAVLSGLCNFFVSAENAPQIVSESSVVYSIGGSRAIFEKNPNEKLSPSSLTKIMSAILVIENCGDLEKPITITSDALQNTTGISTAGLKVGNKYPISELLYYMFLKSAGDAANALAIEVSGSTDKFVELMNSKAGELSMADTKFVNPTGKEDPMQKTTAADLCKLAVYCFANDTFMKYSNESYKRFDTTENNDKVRYLYTTNMILTPSSEYFYPYARGMMNAYSSTSGYSLITVGKKNKDSIVCVTMNAPKDIENGKMRSFTDAKTLLNWAYDNFSYNKIYSKGQPIVSVKVTRCATTDNTVLAIGEDVFAITPKDIDLTKIEYKTDVPKEIKAPIKEGTEVGKVTMVYQGQELITLPMTVQTTLETMGILYVIDFVSGVFTSKYFYLTLVAMVLILVTYIGSTYMINKRRKKKRYMNKLQGTKYRRYK